jgi:hypothetical protein
VPDQELVDHIAASAGLSEAGARRVIEDVLGYYREPVADYVRRRHRVMHDRGARNAEIFTTVAAELKDRLVAAPELSERQLRRLIYT